MKNFTLAVLIFISISTNAQSRSTQSFFGDVSVIELATNGNVWIGSPSHGCAAFIASSQTWSQFTTANSSMRSDSVTAISLYAIHGVGHSFMGTTNGIGYKHGAAWDTLAGLIDPYVIDIVHSYYDNRLYVATKGGISVFNDTSLVHITDLTTSNTLPHGNITCMESKTIMNPGFYYGTSDSGYYYTLDGINYMHKDVDSANLTHNHVNFIFVDTVGANAYCGTKGGFSACGTTGMGPCTNLSDTLGLPQNDVTAIDIDCHGDIWIGTRDSGVVFFYNGSFNHHRITTADGLPSNRITAINCHPGTCLTYIGTADAGAVMTDSMYNIVQLPTGISNLQNEQMNVKVYPQPSSDILNFVLGEELKAGEVSLFDISGKKVLLQKINNAASFSISVKNLEQGFYFYSIRNEKTVLKTGKVSVLR